MFARLFGVCVCLHVFMCLCVCACFINIKKIIKLLHSGYTYIRTTVITLNRLNIYLITSMIYYRYY